MAKVFADDIALNYEGTEPYLFLIASTVYDAGGNNDGRLDSGETVDLTATLRNVGGVDFTNLTTTIECSDAYITISDNLGSFGYLAIDSVKENTYDPYVVSASSSTPIGHRTEFILIATEAGFVDTFNFNLLIGSYSYLVWNPDPTPEPGQTMDSILVSLGYAGDYSTTLDPEIALDVYKAIFVCGGVYPNKCVIVEGTDEANELVDYVINGGRMYLEGGDVWCYDPAHGGYNFGPLFGIDQVTDGGTDMGPVLGQSGTFTENMSFTYEGENMYMDRIAPTGTGFLIFRDSIPGYDCGVANDAGTYRTVGTSFELGGLVDATGVSTKAALLDSIMHFFGVFPTGVEEITKCDVTVPTLKLYPNPFYNRVNIQYCIGHSAKGMELKIYDATGRLVKEFSHATNQRILWNGTDDSNRKLPSGVYFLKFETKDYRQTKKLILLK